MVIKPRTPEDYDQLDHSRTPEEEAEENESYGDSSVSPADMESNPKHEPKTKNGHKKAHPKFRIHVHSKRRRLADADGVYCKAAIDGFVVGGLLPDDSHRYVESVTYSQEQTSGAEETIITIESD